MGVVERGEAGIIGAIPLSEENHMAEEPMLPLASAIEELRAELLDALKQGAGKDLQFKLEPIELELKVVVTKKGEGNAGVRFWVQTFRYWQCSFAIQ